jgi:cyclomaltodextrinase
VPFQTAKPSSFSLKIYTERYSELEILMSHWATEAIFYHIYPLGLCGAPERNDFTTAPMPRLEQLHGWIDHLLELGVNALYLGPVFESSAHGYDTADYYRLDRRLGMNETLAQLSATLHENGIRLILDGVFNHVGRDFWAFRDVLAHGAESAYRDWFHNLQFDGRSPYNDPFTYEGWAGHYDLVKLNLQNPAVRDHLFQAIETWMRDFQIDGLRLDAADVLDLGFLRDLAAFCRERDPEFWLLGEVVHGDYRQWANSGALDSVTNYECYKGLYSSHVDANYFEIAYSLNRQFGEGGLYTNLPLYAFADNHDVDRVASSLQESAHLYPLYCLLFTMPGVPSIYYGSEWGLKGQRTNGNDHPLRPALDLTSTRDASPHPDLATVLGRLARIRRGSPALKLGGYQQLFVGHEQLAFARQSAGQTIVVLVNAADQPAAFDFDLPSNRAHLLLDLLNPGESFDVHGPRVHIDPVWPYWARILVLQ